MTLEPGSREVGTIAHLFDYDSGTETSGPGGAPTPPDLVNNLDGGVDVVDATCSIDGCGSAVRSRGWCTRHYNRWLRHGDPCVFKGSKVERGRALPELERLIALSTDDCVDWPYSLSPKGYGEIKIDGRSTGTHVVSCIRAHGPKPFPSAEVAHSCRSRACLNPRHLRWATPAENAADRLRDGTHARGTRSYKAKLTADEVTEIRRRRADGERPGDLALEFGVGATTIANIVARVSWAWLP